MKSPRKRWRALPRLIRLFIVNSLIGMVIGWLIAAGLLVQRWRLWRPD